MIGINSFQARIQAETILADQVYEEPDDMTEDESPEQQ